MDKHRNYTNTISIQFTLLWYLMKIAIKVSEISSLIGMNYFKSRDKTIRFVRNRSYQNYTFKHISLTKDAVESLIESDYCNSNKSSCLQREQPDTTSTYPARKHKFVTHMPRNSIYFHEFSTSYVYCMKNDIYVHDGIIEIYKIRTSSRIKPFIPLIDVINIQFYLLLTKCRRCLLIEDWKHSNYKRSTFIKFDQYKLDTYTQLLSESIDFIRNE